MVRIVADTTSCLPLALARQEGIYYVPQIIVIGEESYRDDTQMISIDFLKRQKVSQVLPKTAAPSPADYAPIFQEIADNGDVAVVLAPSGQVSGTVRGATVGAQDFPNVDIRVVDTNLVAGGLGELVLEANRWAKAGMDADTIVAKATEMASRHRVYFLVDTLEYLHKGGRIGTASHLIGSLLQMKPILTLKDGHVASMESQRTHKRALARLIEIVLNECPPGPESHLNLMHGDALDAAQNLAQLLAEPLKLDASQISIYDLTPAILVHSGPGVLVASFFVKS